MRCGSGRARIVRGDVARPAGYGATNGMWYGIAFLLIGIGFAAQAVLLGGWGLLFLWPAVSFVTVGIAYAVARPRMLGKRPEDRPATASEVGRELLAIDDDPWTEEQAIGWWEQIRAIAPKETVAAPQSAELVIHGRG